MTFIYKLVWNLTDKVYVGKTSKPLLNRFREHMTLARSGKGSLVHSAIREFGEPTILLLEECTSEESGSAERRWVLLLNSANPTGFNKSLGGEGKDYWTEEQKQAQSELTKLKLNTPANRERHLQSLATESHRQRHSESMRSTYQTEAGKSIQSSRAKNAALNRSIAENKIRAERARSTHLSENGNAKLRAAINTPEAIAKKKASLALYHERKRNGVS